MSENESTKRKRRGKPHTAMTTAELRGATAEFDREFVAETFGTPTPQQRAQLCRARRKRGRPRVGRGAKTISVTIEMGLLAKADRLARRLRTSRANLIARGLRSMLESC